LNVSDFTELLVWKKAHALALDIYRVAAALPRAEVYGLQAQMRRAAFSIPTNLAEGSGRSTNRDFARFVSNAIGSASELDYQLLLAADLGYVEPADIASVKIAVVEVRRMLSSLRKHLVGDLEGERPQ
jgi:four helix bundle protein